MPTMTLNDGGVWEPTEEQIAKWTEAYKAVDVMAELKAASCWLDSNPTRRKTKRGISRFCNSWLSRAQDRGGSGMTKPKTQTVATRDMSTLDDLTQLIIDTPEMREYFLQRHGQYFLNGQRYTA